MVQDHSGGNLIHRFCFSRKHNYTGNHLSGVQITLVLSVHCFRSIITWSCSALSDYCRGTLWEMYGVALESFWDKSHCNIMKGFDGLQELSLFEGGLFWVCSVILSITLIGYISFHRNNETFATGTAIPVTSYSYQGKGLYIIRQDIQQYSPSEIRNML